MYSRIFNSIHPAYVYVLWYLKFILHEKQATKIPTLSRLHHNFNYHPQTICLNMIKSRSLITLS